MLQTQERRTKRKEHERNTEGKAYGADTMQKTEVPPQGAPARERSESSLSAPRLERLSFCEVPEELLSLDLDDIALPPMNEKAKPKTSHHYSLRDLIRNTAALPPVTELRPKQKEGKIVVDAMRERPQYSPVAPGTPTRFQALLSLRDNAGAQGNFTADFLKRTGLEIPAELDPDIPSRRESNLSASDWEYDEEVESRYAHARLPPLTEAEGINESDLHNAFAAKGLSPMPQATGGGRWECREENENGKQIVSSPHSVPKSDDFVKFKDEASGRSQTGGARAGETLEGKAGEFRANLSPTPAGGIDLDLTVSTADKLLVLAAFAAATGGVFLCFRRVFFSRR